MDFTTHLPVTPEGYNTLLVIVDRLTKMVILVPMTDTASAADVASLFLNHVFKHFGMPDELITDRDPIFTSAFFKALSGDLQVKHCLTFAYHPQSDGQT